MDDLFQPSYALDIFTKACTILTMASCAQACACIAKCHLLALEDSQMRAWLLQCVLARKLVRARPKTAALTLIILQMRAWRSQCLLARKLVCARPKTTA